MIRSLFMAAVVLVHVLMWTAKAAGSPILMPLSEVRPGMVGNAYTVFQGTKPEPFKVRVISVMRNFLPKQDIILIRAEDPRLEAMGIAAGMSGSPVYVDGRLVGAIAYGWSFAKEPLAGVTPIESMIAEAKRPGRRPADPYLAEAGKSPSPEGSSLLPAAIPLSVSGASDASIAFLAEELAGYGLRPIRAGGGGAPSSPGELPADRQLVPGAAVGVALVQGDMSTTAMGTLTYEDGKQVLAFGHSMLGIGAVKLPMVEGEIHAIIPSLSSSLKMSSPVRVLGSITYDSRNGVVGVLGEMAETVPVSVRVTNGGGERAPFSVEIARHRRLLPALTTMVVSTALADSVPDVTDMIADVSTVFSIRGFDPIVLRDQLVSNETLAPRVLAMSHGMRALAELLGNPFAPAVIDKIEVRANVEYRPDGVEIVALAAPGGKLRAGTRVPLRVTLRPFSGSAYVDTLIVDVPRELAGHTIKVEVAGGAKVQPEAPRPENLRGVVENLRLYYPSSAIVVSLSTHDDGASLRGQVLRNLPPSALDTLKPVNQTRRGDLFHVVKRTAFPRPHVFTGRQELTVRVHDR